jgi:transposase InsO family protein
MRTHLVVECIESAPDLSITKGKVYRLSGTTTTTMINIFNDRDYVVSVPKSFLGTPYKKSEKVWIARLHHTYSSFEEWESYSETYGLSSRLGYDSAEEAWEDNPMVQGSIKPSDFKKVESFA